MAEIPQGSAPIPISPQRRRYRVPLHPQQDTHVYDDTILVTLALIAAIGLGGVLSLISLVVMAIALAVDD